MNLIQKTWNSSKTQLLQIVMLPSLTPIFMTFMLEEILPIWIYIGIPILIFCIWFIVNLIFTLKEK